MSESDKPAAPTMPPSAAERTTLAEFEQEIKREGEARARWSRLLALLEQGQEQGSWSK